MSFTNSTQVGSPKELATLIKKTKCVVIKFSARWCGPCQNHEFKHNYNMLKEEFSRYSEIKFVELDLDDDDEIVNSTKYYDFAIKSIPHFKFCYDGNIIDQYDGAQSLIQIYENLKKVVRVIESEKNEPVQTNSSSRSKNNPPSAQS